MTWEILAAAKLEIGVFFLAALLHFLLFSNRAPVKLSSKACSAPRHPVAVGWIESDGLR